MNYCVVTDDFYVDDDKSSDGGGETQKLVSSVRTCYGFPPVFLIFRDMDDVLCVGY